MVFILRQGPIVYKIMKALCLETLYGQKLSYHVFWSDVMLTILGLRVEYDGRTVSVSLVLMW